jgi:hypothetical protein
MIKRSLTRKLPPIDADILIAPGGYKGIYMTGICHYIKHHFDISSKKILGFSCGTFCSLLLRIKPELENPFLTFLFSLDKKKLSLPKLLNQITEGLNTRFQYDDFDLRNTQIGVTTSTGLKCYDNFLTLKDLIHCCKCSSFIPFVTHNELFLVYKHGATLDGGIYYKQMKALKKNRIVISSSMFGRFSSSMIQGFRKPKISYYQMYLNGYHDARKNHALLETMFGTKSS